MWHGPQLLSHLLPLRILQMAEHRTQHLLASTPLTHVCAKKVRSNHRESCGGMVENHCNKLKEKSKTLQLWIRLQLKIVFVRPKKHLATQVTSPPGCRPVKFDSKRVWRLREAMGAMMLHEKQKDLKPVSLGWLAEGSSTWPRGHNLPMLPRFSSLVPTNDHLLLTIASALTSGHCTCRIGHGYEWSQGDCIMAGRAQTALQQSTAGHLSERFFDESKNSDQNVTRLGTHSHGTTGTWNGIFEILFFMF